MDKIKNLAPESLLKILRNLRATYFNFQDSQKPYLNKIKYCGFSLYYTRGQGLINRIRFGSPNRIYESDLSLKLVSLLSDKENPLFIDVGCNIGLISLYVLGHVPAAKVLAFEPGPHQGKLFDITIFANQLEDRIILTKKALSDKNGTIKFHVHKNPEDCGGDGIMDTERGGETREIEIESIKLDDHIQDVQIQSSNIVMKLDTEGAELLVLRGASDFISKNKPVIVLEITNLNIKNYDYTALDILNFLHGKDYAVYTLDEQTEMTAVTIEAVLNTTDSFISYPKSTL